MKHFYLSLLTLVLFGMTLSPSWAQSEKPILTIGCLSDLHCEGSNLSSPVQLKTSVTTTLNKMKTQEKLDVILLGGDLTSKNDVSQSVWNEHRDTLTNALVRAFNGKTAKLSGAASATPLIITTGNHEFQACSAPNSKYNSADYYTYPMSTLTGSLKSTTTSNVSANANECFYETLGSTSLQHVAAYHYQINGIDFIGINTSNYNFNKNTQGSGWTYSTAQANWVAAKLNKIKAADPNRLVFVVEHFMFSGSNNTNPDHVMPDRDGTPILKQAYASYPRLIMLYGHDHSGSVYISSKTSERVTRYNTSGTKISTTDKNHVDGTTQGTGSVTANSSFMSCFMGSMNYRNNTSCYQALMIYVYNDRVELHMKNYNSNTTLTPYTYFYTDTTPGEDPQPGEGGTFYVKNVENGQYLTGTTSLSFSSSKTSEWTLTNVSGNTFTMANGSNYLYYSNNSSSKGFQTSTSSKNIYLFNSDGTPANSITAGNTYYIVADKGTTNQYEEMGNEVKTGGIIGDGTAFSLNNGSMPSSAIGTTTYQFVFEATGTQPQTKTLYGKLTVSGSNGKIYAAATSGAASGNATVEVNDKVATSATSAKKTVYLYATANTGYEFLGWSTSTSESNIISGSNVAEYAYEFTFNGTSQGGATSKTLYAIFKQKTQPQPSGNSYYLYNLGNESYLNGTVSSNQNEASFSFSKTSKQVWDINSLSSTKTDLLRITTTQDNVTNNIYYGQISSSVTSKAFKLYNKATDNQEKYNVYLYEIKAADINKTTIAATRVSAVTAGNYYFIAGNNGSTGTSSMYVMGNTTNYNSAAQAINPLNGTLSNSNKTLTVNNASKAYIYQFVSAGSTPEPQTKTLYGKLTVSGSNGKIYAAATSGAASGNATVEVNDEVATSATSAKKTVYLYATANTDYEFLGWSTDNSESNIISGSNVAEYAYEFTFNGTSQGGATSKTLYAIFKQKTQPGEDGAYYIKNYEKGTYFTSTSSKSSLSSTKQEFKFKSLNNSGLYRVYFTTGGTTYSFDYERLVFAPSSSLATSTSESDNLFFYEIADINAGTLSATKVNSVQAGKYYFILGTSKSSGNTYIMSNTPYNSSSIGAVQIADGKRPETISISKTEGTPCIYTLESKNPEYVTVHVGSTGYATYCSSMSLEVPSTSGVEVFGAKLNAEKSAAILSNAVTPGFVIKANTGFLVKATPNTDVKFACKTEVGSTIAYNDLVGVTTATKFTTEDVVYLLANDGNDNAVFKRNKVGSSAENTLSANKAYFINPVPKAKYINDILDIEEGDATGINGLNGNDNTDALYNINGVRVNNSYNGVIIKNGKKFLQIR